MSRELGNCYEVLGVAEGASAQELKAAYRDLAKVWHPDRFAHDPRLQQKAQEKLKEINEAYEQLTSGKSRYQKQTSSTRQPRTPSPDAPHAPPDTTRTATWRLVILPVCVFTLVLLISGSLLIAGRETTPQNTAQGVDSNNLDSDTVNSVHVEQPIAASKSDSMKEPPRAGRKHDPKQIPVKPVKEPTVERAAVVATHTVTPLPTVTLRIDPTTGLIATAHCPSKSRMTYADGSEPRQYCHLHQNDAGATSAETQQKESRIKSLSKRLASPTKWFKGKEKAASTTPAP